MLTKLPMNITMMVSLVLQGTAAAIFWNKKLQRRIPAMGLYLCLVVAQTAAALVTTTGIFALGRVACAIYFYEYWTFELLAAIALFFAFNSILRAALEALPGSAKVGLLAFRCAAAISIAAVGLTSHWTGLGRTSFVNWYFVCRPA